MEGPRASVIPSVVARQFWPRLARLQIVRLRDLLAVDEVLRIALLETAPVPTAKDTRSQTLEKVAFLVGEPRIAPTLEAVRSIVPTDTELAEPAPIRIEVDARPANEARAQDFAPILIELPSDSVHTAADPRDLPSHGATPLTLDLKPVLQAAPVKVLLAHHFAEAIEGVVLQAPADTGAPAGVRKPTPDADVVVTLFLEVRRPRDVGRPEAPDAGEQKVRPLHIEQFRAVEGLI